MMSNPVQVSNISPSTSEVTLHEFFSFCGKIDKIDFNGSSNPKTATIYFEKPSAARTALMLNGGTLDGSNLTVTSDDVHPDADHHHDNSSGPNDEHIRQEDKPRSGIAAEYLAKGYVLSDQILQKAIEIDQKQGISSRFLTYIKNVDSTIGKKLSKPEDGTPQTLSGKVQASAKQIDQERGITNKATTYYEKAMASPIGQKVYSFYSSTSKQVLDIHEEARRIAWEQKTPTPPSAAAAAEPSKKEA